MYPSELYDILEQTDIRKLAEEAIRQTIPEYLDQNLMQLELGLNSDGTRIGTYMSDDYAARKYQQNSLAGEGQVDLILTGDFVEHRTFTLSGDKFTLDSGDWKTADLERNYGKEFFGLMDDRQEFYNFECFYPVFQIRFTAKTGLLFE